MNRRQGFNNKHPETVLAEWDETIHGESSRTATTLHERRAFLTGALKSGAVLSAMPLWLSLSGCERQTAQQELVIREPWRTFAAVQQQLFPADGNGPSARDIHASLYLSFIFQAADTAEEDRAFLRDGIGWLNKLTDREFGSSFVNLNSNKQRQAIQKIAGSRAGERWLSLLILYIIEALLSDPVYGGNPHGIGWEWLEHKPGFPQPNRNKRYTELV